MMRLNKVGAALGDIDGVHAMTDVTGFGLAGHGLEMARATGSSSSWKGRPCRPSTARLLRATTRTGASREGHVEISPATGQDLMLDGASDFVRDLVCDPQTSGGLLLSVSQDSAAAVERVLKEEGLPSSPIGEVDGRRARQAEGPLISGAALTPLLAPRCAGVCPRAETQGCPFAKQAIGGQPQMMPAMAANATLSGRLLR